jgi:TetR/AcrR family transcriptional repressor of nem operon
MADMSQATPSKTGKLPDAPKAPGAAEASAAVTPKTAGCARGRPRAFDTKAVLAQAGKVFWARGYHATSIDDLCHATGLLRGSLYGVFGDKHGILLAALDQYAEGAIAALVERLAVDVPARQAVRTALLHHARAASALQQKCSCLMTNTTLEMPADDEELRARIESFHRRNATLLAAAVIRGQAAGEFNPSLDEQRVADFLLCVTQGLRVLSKVRQDEAELTAIVDVAMRALL